VSDAGDKLARSRLAIIEHIQRKERRHERNGVEDDADDGEEAVWQRPPPGAGASGWLASFKHAASTWWRHHPAHLGVEVATPMLSSYASRKPAQFLGIAAAVGAVVMIAKPWRLISLTGVIVALVKSSQLSNVVMSAMSAADFHRDRPPMDRTRRR